MRLPTLPDDPTVRRTLLAAAAIGLATVVALLGGLLDGWSLLLIAGGSAAVARATFPTDRLLATWTHLRDAVTHRDPDPAPLIAAVKRLARVHRLDGAPGLERAVVEEPEGFLRRALLLGIETDGPASLAHVLTAEAGRETAAIEASRQVVLTFGKLFPAFGLIGTLLGLGTLLRNLSGGDLATIAPGLAMAIQTTLLGALLSNAVALPLATRLHAHAVRRTQQLQMLIDGATLVLAREYPSQIERVLHAHLGTTPVPAPKTAPATPARPARRAPIRLTDRAA